MKFNSCILSSLLVLASFSSSAEELLKRQNVGPELNCSNGPAKIKDKSEFNLLFGDYSEESGTLKIISRNPLKVHVYAEVFAGDPLKVKEHLVKKAIISNIYQVFTFSDINKITVTSSVKEINIANGVKAGKLLKSPAYTITKTRDQALSDLRKLTNAKSFNDLFIGYYQVCQFSPVFKQFLYDDQGGVGVSQFFNQVKK
ncbi:hypothetical protein JAG56_004615 [Raoultella ornithinolytica]|uniref:hypothetical protein n=1 Tax=Raoultella ornithinolytica TaxID=54291 RepID=UPI000FEB99D2|nr:hypothetical protein [Raoultella ornithinolytica]ELS0897696.1 hypothetical protein [Raoultella ornithinolytica]RWT99476.1 hypothetical protein DN602_14060 [Raoultella ornithinolytica]